jgi:hypothetical protein
MKQSDVIKWYSQPEIALAIVNSSENKEVAILLNKGSFGKRPQILQFPADVKAFARKGTTSFHISVENFSDPLKLSPETTEAELTELREGWDLIIDIDCPWFDYSIKTAQLIIEYLKSLNVTSIGLKFSGNKGWHISVPQEAFPEKILRGKISVKKTFPILLERILTKMKNELNEYLNTSNQSYYEKDISTLLKVTGKTRKEISIGNKIDYLKLMDIDLAIASPRHLIRSPYSLHEKSGLASIVIDPEEISSFKKEFAKLENVKETKPFFKRDQAEIGEAKKLFAGITMEELEEQEKRTFKRSYEQVKLELNKDLFPPCMKRILNGLEDGRKRALLALINFYKNFDMDWAELEDKIYEWNKKNSPPLKKGYIRSQLIWHSRQGKTIPPPNCKEHYKGIGVCFPDSTCKRIKNPLTYVSIKLGKPKKKKSPSQS